MPHVARFDGSIVDVGSGGGSPGIPLAAALPDREVTLLEANGRKAAFLERIAAGFPNVRVVRGRAEEQDTDMYGVAVARALAPPPVAAEWCLPLVREGGGVVLYVGPTADRRRRGARGGEGRRRRARGPRRRHRHSQGPPDAAWLPAPTGSGKEASARVALGDNGRVPSTVFALANQKGGVGKTTTAVNLAACLADAGEQVLVVDLDPQANATSGLGERANGTSSYDLLDGAPLESLAKPTRFGNLHLVPSRPELAGAAVELSQREDGERFLAQALHGRTSRFSFVFVDCPPSLGPLTVNALAAADAVLVPVQAEYYALEGLAQLLDSVELVRRRLNPRLSVAGVLLTMVDRRTRLAGEVEADVRKAPGRPRVPDDRPSIRAAGRGAEPRPAGDCLRPPIRGSGGVLEGGDGACRAFLKLTAAGAASAVASTCSSEAPRRRTSRNIPVDAVHPNPRQPRRKIDGEAVSALAGLDPRSRASCSPCSSARGRPAAGS